MVHIINQGFLLSCMKDHFSSFPNKLGYSSAKPNPWELIIRICLCLQYVCVCVCKRERERQIARERERERCLSLCIDVLTLHMSRVEYSLSRNLTCLACIKPWVCMFFVFVFQYPLGKLGDGSRNQVLINLHIVPRFSMSEEFHFPCCLFSTCFLFSNTLTLI